jgi:hypothetical protein
MNYLDQIDTMIDYHKNEIDRLQTARSVVQQLQQLDRSKAPAMTLDVTPQVKSAAITIRRLDDKQTVKRPHNTVDGRKQGAELRAMLTTLLADIGPLTSGQIRARLADRLNDQQSKQLWNALYYMSKVLKTVVYENKHYRLVNG